MAGAGEARGQGSVVVGGEEARRGAEARPPEARRGDCGGKGNDSGDGPPWCF